ncbi:unnamed protein product [Rhizophagus irregularis]|nr:unnamed protein product [Rhizophagus irregularis]
MRKVKDYSEDEYKNTTELEDKEETMDDMTENELISEDEDELVAEDEDKLMAEDEGDEFVAEDEDELMAEDEGELLVEDEHAADEPVAEDEEEPRAEDDDGTRPEVPIQRSERGTRSIKSRSRNKGGASKSSVWNHFDTKTVKYPGRPVCRKCNTLFSAGSGTSTLRRHLSSHKIPAPKRLQRTMHDYRIDPHPEKEQEERDKMEPALNLLAADDPNVRQRYLGEVDCVNVDDTMVLLSPIKHATRLLSASNYSTHGDVRFVFLSIKEHLSRYINDESFSQCIVADAIYQKLSNYWPIMSESSQISSLLDPRVKFTAFEDEIEKANAKNLVLNLTEYSSTLSPLLTTTGEAGDDIVKTRNFFRNLRNNTVALENTNTLVSRTLDNEMERR